jgi:hypothetical protein
MYLVRDFGGFGRRRRHEGVCTSARDLATAA